MEPVYIPHAFEVVGEVDGIIQREIFYDIELALDRYVEVLAGNPEKEAVLFQHSIIAKGTLKEPYGTEEIQSSLAYRIGRYRS